MTEKNSTSSLKIIFAGTPDFAAKHLQALIAPIAISVAMDLGYSPYPFAMTVAIATSASFITPVSSPVKTMIVAPGGYSFSDFVKVGVPLTFLVLLANLLLVPVFFPF